MSINKARENWVKEQTPKEQRNKAQEVLDDLKSKRGKTKLVQVDAKTWKEVPM